MPRPRKCRLVSARPLVNYFKPRGIPMHDLQEVRLSLEGHEALRLADLDGLCRDEAAARMGVSRQTFSRVLVEARRAVAEAVVGGRALYIEGGAYRLPDQAAPPQDKETAMSKIAISSEGPRLDDLVDPRFGRSGGFIIVDTQNMETTYLDNGAAQARGQGAGIQAAELVAGAGATVVLTGFVGPKAFAALQAAGVGVGQDLGGVSVREAVQRYLDGRVPLAANPNR
ncbi:MAG: DUF134 domain-containing protein [Pseudomonadota bacterium]